MRLIVVVLIGLMVNCVSAQTSTQKSDTEQSKNEVEVALDESKKKGEEILGACLPYCAKQVISRGVIIGRIISLPKPDYPRLAKRAHVSGTVIVTVIVDTDGKVSHAAPADGNPLLRPFSVAAARNARFAPVLMGGKPVRVTGVIRYNFILLWTQ